MLSGKLILCLPLPSAKVLTLSALIRMAIIGLFLRLSIEILATLISTEIPIIQVETSNNH